MTSTEVRTDQHSYPVLIGPGLLETVGDAIKEKLAPSRCAIISDTNVAPLFAGKIQKSLATAGFESALITVPACEQSKTLEQAGAVCEEMLRAGLDRQSFVIGLGGGVVGDLSGFVAAIFQRGIPHVQIPTTLLAMVDSSIGGKTGVNTSAGKNLIGAVHQPALVIDDVDILKTLPRPELSQGFAEIIKHAIIADAEMFSMLEDVDLNNVDFAALVRRNVEIKARIVAKDELDRTGDRALLNFGHTVGHGIERAVNYQGISHGEAVSLGMVAACEVSIKKVGLPERQREAIVDLLAKLQLPAKLPANFPRQKIFDALKFDKKFERGQIRFVVTPKIGSAKLSRDVAMDDIRAAVEKL
ncbi:MAG TPA: 3-dehydroquinate synthase [Chthoniobacterales bacterium]|nr:3-dehydroquinate synthase [Chthoniobacterales bacterium]